MSDRKKIVGSFAVIFNDTGEVLLGQRNEPDTTHPFHMKWGFPGGIVDEGETPEDAAIRETFEETGVKIQIVNHRPIVNTTKSRKTGEDIILLYYPAKFISGDLSSDKDHGTNDVKWFNKINENETLPKVKEIIDEMKGNILFE